MFDPYNTKTTANYADIERARERAIQNYLPLPNNNNYTDTDTQFGGSGIRNSFVMKK
jgi:hypothetical protein